MVSDIQGCQGEEGPPYDTAHRGDEEPLQFFFFLEEEEEEEMNVEGTDKERK